MLKSWQTVIEVVKKKQAVAIALSLPEDTSIREKVFDELQLDTLNAQGSFDELIQFFDKHLGKDDLLDCLERWEEFEDFKREKVNPLMIISWPLIKNRLVKKV